MDNMFDLIIVGAGSGGIRTARKVAEIGKKIAIIEASNIGGTCVNLGCIPKKIMMYSSQMRRLLSSSHLLGWNIQDFQFNWPNMIKYREDEIERIRKIYDQTLSQYSNITLIKGYAKFLDNKTICINDQTLYSDKILIATGSKTQLPNIPGKELFTISDQAFFLPKMPKKFAVVGGGYIAMEFASIMNGFGSEVTIIHRNDNFLKLFDQDSVQHLIQEMKKQGIKFITNVNITSLSKESEMIACNLDNNESILFDCILCATGRIPNTDKLELNNTDIKLGRDNKIIVDHFTSTNVHNIHAIGDVTGNIGLTPIAIREAHAFVDNAYNNIHTSTDYNNIPIAVFTQPSLSKIGYSELEAKEKFGHNNIKILTSKFIPLVERFKLIHESNFIKMVINKSNNKVIGLHMVGEIAPDVIQIATVCINAGLTVEEFKNSIALHPTVSEEIVLMVK